MGFEVPAAAYDRFMGRFSRPLAARTLELLDPAPPARVLDVGCGPGVLTAPLAARLGAAAVSAVDPSVSFVEATRERLPGVDVRRAGTEELPFADDTFDLAVAQLVVHFMAEPVAGLREMARVTRRGGRVAASVWDLAGRTGPLEIFWQAAHQLDADVHDESDLAGGGEGDLVELAEAAGLVEVRGSALSVVTRFDSVEDWWEPFTFGVGPAGSHVVRLHERERAALRSACAALLPEPPFEIAATAWCAVGLVA